MHDARDAAFARTYRAEYSVVLTYCRNRVDEETARDLTAEAFRALWTRWGESRRSDRAWLITVAHNLVVDEYRRRTRDGSGAGVVRVDVADDRAAAQFDRADLRQALASLAPKDQEVLQMRYWDDLSTADIAAALGTSVGAVWVRLSRARRALAVAWGGAPAPLPVEGGLQ